jgi:predicted RND superfamily exporter protein
MKTAMQELYKHLEKLKEITDTVSITDLERMIGNYHIEKEKQQIKDAYNEDTQRGENDYGEDSEHYYNQTFILGK